MKTREREEREKIENDERRKRTKWEVGRGGGEWERGDERGRDLRTRCVKNRYRGKEEREGERNNEENGIKRESRFSKYLSDTEIEWREKRIGI